MGVKLCVCKRRTQDEDSLKHNVEKRSELRTGEKQQCGENYKIKIFVILFSSRPVLLFNRCAATRFQVCRKFV
jgi:hypothetical protein